MGVLADAIQRGEFLVTAEISPPKGTDVSAMLSHAKALQGLVHAVNVTDGSRAVMAMSPLAAAVLIQQQTGLEVICQMACRDRNRLALQGDLLGASALGIRNILALTGDPVTAGDQPEAKPVFDYESVRLLRLIAKLNGGKDANDRDLPQGGTNFLAGAAVDPQSPSWSGLKTRFCRKLEAGAQFFQSQLVTDFDRLAKFMAEIASLGDKPVLAGIFLLKSAKNAQFINKYVPGVHIPDHIIKRLAQAADPLDMGITIAAEQIQQARTLCQGVHVMAVKAEHLIPEILRRAGVGAHQIQDCHTHCYPVSHLVANQTEAGVVH
ncbi:MAG: methylenetetrahydrofolate reductase [Pseudanabaenaceae cyanobacterium SKYG29]|nr:methylenetetrahydrofolate reductase [Pseudanabaenaceae cyanobacterium SKYG29]